MTFYEILADHYTKPVAPENSDPYVSFNNWASIVRFFGEGTTWRSDAAVRFSISGRVTDGSGNGIGGVTLNLNGPQAAIATTGNSGAYSFVDLTAGGNFVVAPTKPGYSFNPASASFSNLSGNQVANFMVTDVTPVLITEENSSRAIALDSVTMLRDPFPVDTSLNFSADQHTRIMLFAANVALRPGEEASAVAVQVEDAQHRLYNLPVEFVGKVPNHDWLTEIVVRLSDDLRNAGDVQIGITYAGRSSNRALLSIR